LKFSLRLLPDHLSVVELLAQGDMILMEGKHVVLGFEDVLANGALPYRLETLVLLLLLLLHDAIGGSWGQFRG